MSRTPILASVSRVALRASVLALLTLLPGLRADAAPIQRPVEAVLALHSGLLPTVFFTGSGVATVDVNGDHVDGLSLPAGILATQITAGLTGLEVRVDARNGAGSFGTVSGVWSGTMPIEGSLRLCLGATCDASPLTDVFLPLDVVGISGSTTSQVPGGTVSIRGARWQTQPLRLSGSGFVSVFSGYQSGPGGLTSSTARPGGFMLFVTPAHVSIPDLGTIDFVAELAVFFVPEPATWAFVASGLLGLGLVLRRPR